MLRALMLRNFRSAQRLEHWVNRRLTRAGVVVLGATVAGGVFGLDTRQTLSYQVAAFGVVLLLAGVLWGLTVRLSLRVDRRLPRYGTVGEPVTYSVRVTNAGPRAQRGLALLDELETRLPDSEEFRAAREPGASNLNWFDRRVAYPRWAWLVRHLRGATSSPVPLPVLPPGEPVQVNIGLTPLRRGVLRFERFNISCADPLGLVNAVASVPAPGTLLVLPRRYPVPPLNLPGGRRYQPGGVTLAGSVGDAQEFVSLREYRPGDPLRHIHWRSWARLGEPVVREYQEEFFARQALVLDTFAPYAHGTLLEGAVSVAASLVAGVTPRDGLIDLLFAGDRVHCITAGRGLSSREGLLEALACVQASVGRPFSDLREAVMRHAAGVSGCICVLMDWDEERRALVKALREGGVPVMVLLVSEADTRGGEAPGPLAGEPERFQVVRTRHLEQDLAGLPTGDGGR